VHGYPRIDFEQQAKPPDPTSLRRAAVGAIWRARRMIVATIVATALVLVTILSCGKRAAGAPQTAPGRAGLMTP
jgi:hypothetical protein